MANNTGSVNTNRNKTGDKLANAAEKSGHATKASIKRVTGKAGAKSGGMKLKHGA